jgi:hypothetical protein
VKTSRLPKPTIASLHQQKTSAPSHLSSRAPLNAAAEPRAKSLHQQKTSAPSHLSSRAPLNAAAEPRANVIQGGLSRQTPDTLSLTRVSVTLLVMS